MWPLAAVRSAPVVGSRGAQRVYNAVGVSPDPPSAGTFAAAHAVFLALAAAATSTRHDSYWQCTAAVVLQPWGRGRGPPRPGSRENGKQLLVR